MSETCFGMDIDNRKQLFGIIAVLSILLLLIMRAWEIVKAIVSWELVRSRILIRIELRKLRRLLVPLRWVREVLIEKNGSQVVVR